MVSGSVGRIAGSGQNFQQIMQRVHLSGSITGRILRQDAVLFTRILPREAGMSGISFSDFRMTSPFIRSFFGIRFSLSGKRLKSFLSGGLILIRFIGYFLVYGFFNRFDGHKVRSPGYRAENGGIDNGTLSGTQSEFGGN
jgi:hypothetical protein